MKRGKALVIFLLSFPLFSFPAVGQDGDPTQDDPSTQTPAPLLSIRDLRKRYQDRLSIQALNQLEGVYLLEEALERGEAKRVEIRIEPHEERSATFSIRSGNELLFPEIPSRAFVGKRLQFETRENQIVEFQVEPPNGTSEFVIFRTEMIRLQDQERNLQVVQEHQIEVRWLNPEVLLLDYSRIQDEGEDTFELIALRKVSGPPGRVTPALSSIGYQKQAAPIYRFPMAGRCRIWGPF